MNIYDKVYEDCGWAPFGWTAREISDFSNWCAPGTAYNKHLRRCEPKIKECGPGTQEVDGVCQIEVTKDMCEQSCGFKQDVGAALNTLEDIKQAIKSHPFAHDEFSAIFACVDEKAATDAFQAKLNTMHGFAGVQTGIPSDMMSNIGSTAHNLAGEIATGKMDISSLIGDIGGPLLQGLDQSGMESFSQNIGSLLPMLGNLQSGLSAHMPTQA